MNHTKKTAVGQSFLYSRKGFKGFKSFKGEISQHLLTFRTAPQVRLKLLKLFQSTLLAFIVLPLGVTHIARLEELLVHSQCAAQGVRGMSSLRHLQVLVQQWAVLWVHTVVDDLVSTLDRALTTQVSNTVLGDDDLHRVLAVVVVANHRQEC